MIGKRSDDLTKVPGESKDGSQVVLADMPTISVLEKVLELMTIERLQVRISK